MNGKLVAGCGAALLAGAALGWFLKPAPPPPAVEPAKTEKSSKKGKIAEAIGAADAARIAALRARVADLEAALKAARLVREDVKTTKVPDASEGQDANSGAREHRRMGMRERLAKLAKEDPVRFAQFTNRMERGRIRRGLNAAAKCEFLASIDTARMSDSAKKTHEELQKAIARREALNNALGQISPEGEPTDELRKLEDERRALDRAIRELSKAERDTLLAMAVRNMGVEGAAAEEAVTALKEVAEATEGGHGGPPGPPPGGDNPPPGGSAPPDAP